MLNLSVRVREARKVLTKTAGNGSIIAVLLLLLWALPRLFVVGPAVRRYYQHTLNSCTPILTYARVHHPHSHTSAAASAMSSHQTTTKKTLAQLRAEKEQREHGVQVGMQLAIDVAVACFDLESNGSARHEFYDRLNALLTQSTRACELLVHHPDPYANARPLFVKARLHKHLGQHTLVLADLKRLDELLADADRKGAYHDRYLWCSVVNNMGEIYLSTNQLEAAKRCFLKVLAWPRLSVEERLFALENMARHHKERKAWIQMVDCCEKALTLVPQAKDPRYPLERTEERLLLYLADAAEAQGNMRQARELDEKANKIYSASKSRRYFAELESCSRREALEFLKAGKPFNAAGILIDVPVFYADLLEYSGIISGQLYRLTPVIAALKVLADALVQTGVVANIINAEGMRADVEETEAILAT